MKRVKNSDIKFKLDQKAIKVSDFSIKFYTVDSVNFFIELTQDDVVEVEREATIEDEDIIRSGGTKVTDYYLKLDWHNLKNIGNGVLRFRCINNVADDGFYDKQYNRLVERTTQYYIDTVEVDPEDKRNYADLIADVDEKVDAEISRATSAETDLNTSLVNEISRATNKENDLSDLIAALRQDLTEESEVRSSADTSIRNSLNTEIDRAISAETKIANDLAAETTRATNAESAITSNLNNEVSRAIAKENEITATMASNYSALTTALSNEITRAEGQETALNTKIDAETERATTAENALSAAIDTKLSISDFNTYSANTETKIDNAGGFIKVINPSADTKVGLVNKLSQYYDTNIGKGAVIEGDGNEYNGTTYNIVASGDYSHAEGSTSKANGKSSHAEGSYTTASGFASHAEGTSTTASGDSSHAEGMNTKAFGNYSHAEGMNTTASGYSSHAEGVSTKASGDYSHAEGGDTEANGNYSHAEGMNTKAIGERSHAEGMNTKAIGERSHAEGNYTQANGFNSHAEGDQTQAIGNTSHTEGQNTIAINSAEHASGYYNQSNSGETAADRTLFSVGNGYYNYSQWREYRHNAFEIRQNGDIYINDKAGNTVNLQDVIDSKQDAGNYVSATTFNAYSSKTDNELNAKLNISDFNAYSANTKTLIDSKQDTLVSGSNIKTINNTSILGSGNITIEQIQSDWNESDSSKLSYIENKPFGETSGFVNIFENNSFSLVQCGQYNYGALNGSLSLSEELVEGEVYQVTVNGNDFIYTASTYNNILGLNFFGSPDTATVTVFENKLYGGYNISIHETYLNGENSHAAISISKNGYQIVQIDNKYINYSGDTYIQSLVTRIDNKQDSLVSGSNIKTINNTSILGSGNITIEGGFKQVINPSASTKVGLVNQLSKYYSTNIGDGAVIEGDGYEYNGTSYNIVASGSNSHAEGRATQANGEYSHAEGNYTTAIGNSSHAEGRYTQANGNFSHAEGEGTTASGQSSHAEGDYTKAIGNYSHAEGQGTKANGYYSHAEGNGTISSGASSHAEGYYTKASGSCSHAEGNYTEANGDYSHAEGSNTKASGNYSHVEGQYTFANGHYSHAEGKNGVFANGESSHAEGCTTQASGDYSHAEGNNTIANNVAEHASGQYNVSSSASTTFGDSGNTLFSVGNGTSNNARHNAFEIRQNGDIYLSLNDNKIKLQDLLGKIQTLENELTNLKNGISVGDC